MKFLQIVGAIVVSSALVLGPIVSANAATPSPTNPPAPTSNEFAVPPTPTTLRPGQVIAPQRTPAAFQRELAALAKQGHATWVNVDAASGRILSVGDLGFASVNLWNTTVGTSNQ